MRLCDSSKNALYFLFELNHKTYGAKLPKLLPGSLKHNQSLKCNLIFKIILHGTPPPCDVKNTFARQYKFLCRMLKKSHTIAECVIKLLFQD